MTMEAAASASRNDTRSLCATSASSLFLLLPPCIILLAIEIAIRNSNRRRKNPATTPVVAEEEAEKEENPSLSSSILADHPLRGLASKAQQILTDFREAERQIRKQQQQDEAAPAAPSRSPHSISLEIRRCRTLSRRSYSESFIDSTFRTTQSASSLSAKQQGREISPAFTGFCDRLLEANQVWKQSEEIKSLKRSVKVSAAAAAARREARGSAAFKTFCDELLLSNELWKKQKEIEELKEERDRMRRSRVGEITRAAKQVVLDAQKERLVEELVKDVLNEAAESRQAVVDLRREYEKEAQAMVGEWRKEQRQMRREIEQLHAAQEAKSLEQEISNELEDRLFERAYPNFGRGEEEQYAYAQEVEVGYGSDADTYLEEMSMMSSSSTCVGTPLPSPPSKRRSFRTSETSDRAKFRLLENGSPGSPRRKVDPADFVGFSFNPLFFPSKSASDESNGSSRAPSPSASISSAPGYDSPVRSRKSSAVTRPSPLKVAWRA